MYHACEDCALNKTKSCTSCVHNPIFSDVIELYRSLKNNQIDYIPTCPRGYIDCVYDPAYIKYHHPDWYKELYGDLTPKDASDIYCKQKIENEEYCYDDEDK